MFRDRIDAGRRLARALAAFWREQPIVVALPRGGVPVGFEVAHALRAPLDVIVVRKVGHPANPELAIGAVVNGDQPTVVLDHSTTGMLGTSKADVEAAVSSAIRELVRRERHFATHRPGVEMAGRVVIVVDDGIATGHTMRAALQHVRSQGGRRTILAVPVAPPRSLVELRSECDLVVCLLEPSTFHAVGNFYADFTQVTDEEVVNLLDRSRSGLLARKPFESG